MCKYGGLLKLTCGLAVLLGVGGCVSTTFVPTGTLYPAKAANCEIQVFSSALPDRPYEELGMVEGEGDWWKADLEDLLPKLKEEACAGGGDGIILFSSDTFAEGEKGIRVQRVTATVIRWKAGG
ncbi:MAG: hypothetical protein AMXMBFR53_19750 [Gemmatimonadota bacterium]